jgi:hypothetical protein
MLLKNILTTLGIDPRTVRLVAQHLKHYATPGSSLKRAEKIILPYLYKLLCKVQYIFLEIDASSIRDRFESSCTSQDIGKPI